MAYTWLLLSHVITFHFLLYVHYVKTSSNLLCMTYSIHNEHFECACLLVVLMIEMTSINLRCELHLFVVACVSCEQYTVKGNM